MKVWIISLAVLALWWMAAAAVCRVFGVSLEQVNALVCTLASGVWSFDAAKWLHRSES